MPPKKLTEADKEGILQRYRQLDETTTTLAERYGVSTSTISRILKQNLDDEEYEALIQQKRISGRAHSESDRESDRESDPDAAPEVMPLKRRITRQLMDESEDRKPPRKRSRKPLESLEDIEPTLSDMAAMDESDPMNQTDKPRRRQRKRSSALTDDDLTYVDPSTLPEVVSAQLELLPIEADAGFEPAPIPSLSVNNLPTLEEVNFIAGEEFDDLSEDDLDDEDDLDEDLDDDDELEDDLDGLESSVPLIVAVGAKGQPMPMLPLAEAPIPRICYIVIDRAAELITRPLRDFTDLGQVPAGDLQERILPIFDNHRVAKRFSRRMQRIVKVPDGRVFHKVGPCLQAKGITRLLIDGQVYTLN